jgi:type IV pilus assembly protein PilC
MPLIVTPRHLTQRAELYHQLASLTTAGVGLIAAVEMLRDAPPSRGLRKPLTQLAQDLSQGTTFSEALAQLSRGWMPQFDRALLHAGEASGRLDLCFRFLADYYNERARLARQTLSELAYPALILHMAILIFPTGVLTRLVWEGDTVGYVSSKLLLLVPGYTLVLLGVYLSQAGHNELWRSWMERVLNVVPMLGPARSNLALARLSVALESLLNAGVSIVEAWPVAAAASGSPCLHRTVLGWKSSLEAGQTPAEVVRESRVFPDLFTNLYTTGEISGQLDDTLHRLYNHYHQEALRKMHALAQWAPRIVYFLIVLLIAVQIVSFYADYFSRIGQLTQ